MPSKEYSKLVEKFQAIFDVASASGILGWDQQVNLPEKGNEQRARQLERLAGIQHHMTVDPELSDLFALIDAKSGDLTSDELQNVKQLKRGWEISMKLPQELVEEMTRESSLAHEIWVKARAAKDFSLFAPTLEKLIALSKKQAQILAKPGQSLYDVLIDTNYEQGATEAYYRTILGGVKENVVGLLKRIVDSGKAVDQSFLTKQDYSEKVQKRLGTAIVTDLGFDWTMGRLDTAVHPFCSGSFGDVRITTRYLKNWPTGSLFGIIHEAGHGMYEQGLPESQFGLPLGNAVSMAVHESQSRFWENIVCRSKPFWRGQWRRLRDFYPSQLADVNFEQWYAAINKVEPSLIRVEADEGTYDLHILMRFEMEADLFAGRLSVSDIPKAWNKKVYDYLGIDVKNDGEGCLQDVHWSSALFGYFPSYSLGNIIAGQLWAAMRRANPKIEQEIEAGNFKNVLGWLRENVHQHGQRYLRDELVERATGKPLTADDYVAYLETKFGEIYNV
ncbi:MAG: carboxypeptidase M32 [bacterium]|nr:carboxypeptidase M32 [bacterium]